MRTAPQQDEKCAGGALRWGVMILLGASVVTSLVLAARLSKTDVPPPGDPEYDFIMANYRMQDVYDLEQHFVDTQYAFLPIAPPAAFPFWQLSAPYAVPFDWQGFPAEFTKNLVGTMEYGVVVYEVAIEEDPISREIAFLNSNGEEIWSLESPADYEPFAYLTEKYPDLFDAAFDPARRLRLTSIFDPARIRARVRLVPAESFAQYLYNERAVAGAEPYVKTYFGGGSGGGMSPLSGGSTQELEICFMLPRTNRMELTVGFDSADAGRVCEVLTWDPPTPDAAIQPFSAVWTLTQTNLLLTGTTQVTWYDTNVTASVSNRLYVIGKSWTDSDSDGLNNARELLVHKTSVTNADSDADGMPDGWEIKYGLDPRSGLYTNMSCWWRFDEAVGTTARNTAANSYHGYTVNMSTTNWVSGRLGSALWFDGVNDYVRVPQTPAIITQAPFTVSAWVYAETPADRYPSILSDSRWTSPTDIRGYLLRRWSNSTEVARWEVYSPTSDDVVVIGYATPTSMYLTNWIHVAGTFSGTNGGIFINGALYGSYDTGNFYADKRPELWIGVGHISFGDSYWKGRLDDLRVYRSNLSADEIAAMYDAFDDPDGDGYGNLVEFQAGTDPLLSNATPQITIAYPSHGQVLP